MGGLRLGAWGTMLRVHFRDEEDQRFLRSGRNIGFGLWAMVSTSFSVGVYTL